MTAPYESPFERRIGFARTRRAGSFVLVSGTTATTPDGVVAGGADPYAQARAAIANIATALGHEGLGLSDVVRTRVYLTDADRWEDVARAHAEAFGATRPAATMVVVAGLLDPRMLVEIEADAYDASA